MGKLCSQSRGIVISHDFNWDTQKVSRVEQKNMNKTDWGVLMP